MIQKPKGTYDVFKEKGTQIKYLENLFSRLMESYNYEYIRTPIFEQSSLFHRGVGEASDIVRKETYDFLDKGNREMTLRPEGTAGVVRSFIENKRYADNNQPIKNFYIGPMYRYERPQSGRFREFYQMGVEVFGETDAYADAEVISIPVNFYKLLGLKEVTVRINSLGDLESRENYRQALVEYFKPYLDDLCDDCHERYEKNPLRILDCKVDANKEYFNNAPKIIDYLNEASKKHFEEVKKYLEAMEIEYIVDFNIVRGLDYYTHTVFEVTANIESFGSQNVLCGGGRYDKLVETLDGPATKGVGFALGVERLLNALEAEGINTSLKNPDIYVIPIDLNVKDKVAFLVQYLRLNGFIVETDYLNRSLKGNFKQIDRLNCKYMIFVGTDEIKENTYKIRNHETKEEYSVKMEDLVDFFDEQIKEDDDEEDI